METKFDGSCPVCRASWKEGDDIFYQKGENGKRAIKCSDEECYTEQGGMKYVPKSKGEPEFFKEKDSKSTLSGVERKMEQAGALDAQLYNIAYNRLKDIEGKFGDIAIPEKLIFIESWARTIAMSMR
jgi:hypothetical protein